MATATVYGKTTDATNLGAKANASDLTAEASARASADTALGTAITNEATTRGTAVAGLLPLAGGTMSGPIAMGAHKITGATPGTATGEVATFDQLPITALLTKTTSYAMVAADRGVIANGSSLTITLPSAVTAGASVVKRTVKNINASACTLASAAGTIDGAATQSLTQYASLDVVSDGTNWFIV